MADSPILFSAPMVRALLEGRKTQTRQVLRLPTRTFSGGPIYERPDMGGWEATIAGGNGCFTISKDGRRAPAPEKAAIWHRTTGVCMVVPIQTGDRLWVKEAWRTLHKWDDLKPRHLADDASKITYEADKERRNSLWAFGRYRHASCMPRWASRFTLIVTDVRVQRLQDISEADAAAEGVDRDSDGWLDYLMPSPQCCSSSRESYRTLWNHLHGAGAWDGNPWVAAYTFDVHRCNIDQIYPQLPDWDDIRGLAPDATGDLSSEAFARELRDGWR